MTEFKHQIPWVWATVITVVLFVGACARPPSTTVGEGADPFQIDKDVAFRTTYYFRVFDYCVAKKLKEPNGFESVVVPMTDSLYRFRMTGKSKTIFSDIKFESGTLKAWEIDPFGAKVEFDKKSKRVRVIPPQEVAADARRAAILNDIDEMIALRDKLLLLKASTDPKLEIDRWDMLLEEVNKVIKDRIMSLDATKSGLSRDNRSGSANASKQEMTAVQKSNVLKLSVASAIRRLYPKKSGRWAELIVSLGFNEDTLVNAQIDRPGYIERAVKITLNSAKAAIDSGAKLQADMESPKTLSIELGKLSEALDATFEKSPKVLQHIEASSNVQFEALIGDNPSIQCPENAPVRRGFQVLGPEGWRTFDQDERLILAMSSSAQPLISTLKDLSNRVLKARENPEAELLPIVLEQKRLSEAYRMLDAEKSSTDTNPKTVAKTICEALVKDATQRTKVCSDAKAN